MSDFEIQPQLIVLYPQKMFKQFPLKKGAQVLGRAQDADIHLEDELISRKHCEITFDGHEVTVKDLGSTNGTFVDGCQVETAQLRSENRLQLGSMVLKVEFGAPLGLFDLDAYNETTKDSLTGVLNFQTFNNRSLGAIAMARLNNQPLHVATITFTNMNDIWKSNGEQCKDLLLKEMGRILKDESRDQDLLARLNEDTFVFLMISVTPDDVKKHLEQICTTIEHHRFSWKDHPVPINLQLNICSRQGTEASTLQEMIAQCK